MNNSLIGKACNSNDRYALIFFTLLGSSCLATMQTYGDIMQIPTQSLACNLMTKLANPVTDTYPVCSLCIVDRKVNSIVYRYLADTDFTCTDIRALINATLARLEIQYIQQARAHAMLTSTYAARYTYTKVTLADLSSHAINSIALGCKSSGLDGHSILKELITLTCPAKVTKFAAM